MSKVKTAVVSIHDAESFIRLANSIGVTYVFWNDAGYFTIVSGNQRHKVTYNAANELVRDAITAVNRLQIKGLALSRERYNHGYTHVMVDEQACHVRISVSRKGDVPIVLGALGYDQQAAAQALKSVNISSLKSKTDDSDPEVLDETVYTITVKDNKFLITFDCENSFGFDKNAQVKWDGNDYDILLPYSGKMKQLVEEISVSIDGAELLKGTIDIKVN